MSAPPQPPPRGLSLYADLLDPSADSSPATISSAPVLYGDAAGLQSARKPVDPALRFQPIRRPQVKQKSKPSFPKTIPGGAPPKPPSSAPDSAAAPTAAVAGGGQPPPPAAKTTLADWAAREEDEWRYGAAAEKRQRGGRKNKKKNRGGAGGQAETDWDELYDPSRPTNVEEYLRSDERIREVHEWKDLLYRRRNKERRVSDGEEVDDEDENERPSMSNQFAPPPSYSFAPPPPSPPRAAVPDDPTGDDAYARRLRMSQAGAAPAPPPPPPAKEEQGAVISAAPVRYSPPPAAPGSGQEEEEEEEDYRPALGSAASPPDSEQQQRSSNRPGQEGFAHRLMSKYGWTKGEALGSSEKGIATPLRVHVEKRKRRPDSEGGGWAEPAPRTRILGGERKGGGADDGAGAMSEVIVLRNMLEGMDDLRGEVEAGLGQEIGEECGDKYGRVERLYIDIESRQVFIKFTDQISALRAVSELKGRIFNGNAIEAKYFDVDKFESGVYR
ncbi:related to DNA-damage repair protein DRT111 precursor [Cephalotrichum gorgonifer]|uniref:Related to DNA-damage repair protein DRT111 n=1 Tax=Cephalotrichum gorgonifer TaxID=2041049 RepID=A0AAE8MQA4_9PEZI|nr:related to DNA-damage repair protein DRT111 precursor [Cephalotrichum gorgonifer]